MGKELGANDPVQVLLSDVALEHAARIYAVQKYGSYVLPATLSGVLSLVSIVLSVSTPTATQWFVDIGWDRWTGNDMIILGAMLTGILGILLGALAVFQVIYLAIKTDKAAKDARLRAKTARPDVLPVRRRSLLGRR